MNNIPILLIIYNRPNNFKKLIKKLKVIKSKKIYIFADGPNKLKTKDPSLCKKTRILASNLNWKCKIYKNYQKENLRDLSRHCHDIMDSKINQLNEQVKKESE